MLARKVCPKCKRPFPPEDRKAWVKEYNHEYYLRVTKRKKADSRKVKTTDGE